MARPTKYNPDMCETVVTMMENGASKVEVCATIGICYETFQNYQTAHEAFSEAVKKGELLSQAWWEQEGRTSLRDREFNYTGWYMNMKNRFGWKDKQETEHSGSISLAITADDADVL